MSPPGTAALLTLCLPVTWQRLGAAGEAPLHKAAAVLLQRLDAEEALHDAMREPVLASMRKAVEGGQLAVTAAEQGGMEWQIAGTPLLIMLKVRSDRYKRFVQAQRRPPIELSVRTSTRMKPMTDAITVQASPDRYTRPDRYTPQAAESRLSHDRCTFLTVTSPRPLSPG